MLRNKLRMNISLLLGSSGGSLLSGLLKGRLSLSARVEVEAGAVVANALDGTGSSEVLDRGTSDGAVDLVLVAESATGDAEDLGDLLRHLVPSLFVKEHFVVKLILYLDLGPGLFLRLRGLLHGVNFLGRSLGVLTFGIFALCCCFRCL